LNPLVPELWRELGGNPETLGNLEISGQAQGLASMFQVSALAEACVAVTTLAAAELWSVREQKPLRRVRVSRTLANATFRSERMLAARGWTLPEIWDPIAGDYRGADGWIRLHTNYAHHRDAVTRVLGVPAERNAVTAAVAKSKVHELEAAIVAAGGASAALRTREAWASHPQGKALAAEPLVAWDGKREFILPTTNLNAPLAGLRVLDLTRVIAGPVATKFLAAHGADVLRIDPPGFEDSIVLLADTMRGKRCASLDLKSPAGKQVLEGLLKDAHVLVHGYRPDALSRLGFTSERLQALNPGLLVVCHDAYGWSGPWAGRRGFDSLVQMSSGIAHPGNDDAKPTPLPAQALDHGTGYLIAAAVCRALVSARASARLSLARVARLLVDLGTTGDRAEPAFSDPESLREDAASEWGPLGYVKTPGLIEGYVPRYPEPAGSPGRHPASWRERPVPASP
jgi:hypothetical protein